MKKTTENNSLNTMEEKSNREAGAEEALVRTEALRSGFHAHFECD